jgi:predicted NBD/HSP70 family sugar kinase
VAGWAVHQGIIPQNDQSVLANQLVLVGGGITAAFFAWYKTRMVTQKAMIQNINNTDNGVKVVPASAPEPAVSEPVKGTK